MANKRYTFSENKITAQTINQSDSSMWIAFAKDTDCALHKVSAFDPSQLYYNIDISVDEIKKMIIDSSYLYIAYEDSTLIGARYATNNPLSSSTDFSIPAGITEDPIDLLVSGTDLWYLTPGSITDAKLVKMSITGAYQETVVLTGVSNAISLTEDSTSGDLYVVTNTSPSKLVRVYDNGGSYAFAITTLSS